MILFLYIQGKLYFTLLKRGFQFSFRLTSISTENVNKRLFQKETADNKISRLFYRGVFKT